MNQYGSLLRGEGFKNKNKKLGSDCAKAGNKHEMKKPEEKKHQERKSRKKTQSLTRKAIFFFFPDCISVDGVVV